MKHIKSYEAPQPAYGRTPPKPLLIPYWVRSLIKINGLDIKDLKDPKKISEFLPANIIKEMAALNLLSPLSFECYFPLFDESLFKGKNPELTFSEIEAEKEQVLDRLTLVNDQKPVVDPYQIIDLDEEIFVIYVEQGFINQLRFREGALAFVSDCLKTQYRYTPLNEVAKSSLYQRYLELLNEKMPFSAIGVIRK